MNPKSEIANPISDIRHPISAIPHPISAIRHPISRVLIVDDEKSIRNTLSAFLRDAGYEVEVAEDVQRAQELMKQEKYDVVVSDIILPRVTGVALLKQIRETAPDVQVIMMTGEPTVDTAVEAVRAGACDYLTKPVSKPAILQSIANAAKIKRLEDEKARLEASNRNYQENLKDLVEQRTRDLQEALETLKKAQEQLVRQERMHALGQMASGIAHDFNNVLMPIMGFSEMLLRDSELLDDRKETIHMLEMINSSAEDARNIVRRLRQIYKEEEVEYTLMDLPKVLESCVSITMPKWKEEMSAAGIKIEILTEFEDVPLIKGNASELREALTNLIFNAVDALPDGGQITLRARLKDERHVVCEVSDTGIGMDADTVRRCIEPFFTTKGVQGTGLGLSMVMGIMERHRGSLEVESEPGAGTTVRMRFPVPVEAEAVEEKAESEPERLQPKKILIIDDEARSRNLLARYLKGDGHAVQVAESGPVGLEMVGRDGFDLVITDRAMPHMGGDEVAAQMAKIAPAVPVIMLTGFGDIMKDKSETPFGVTAVVSKPVTRAELRRTLAKLLGAEVRKTGA